jgi:hypothetical protein
MGLLGDIVSTPGRILGSVFSQGGGPGADTGYDEEKMRAIKDRFAKLQNRLDELPGIKPLGAEAPSYQAKDLSGPLAEFEPIRQQALQQANAGTQNANDALQRRYAAMGGGNSGAFIKQQQQLLQNGEDKKQEVLNNVNAQEAQARRALQQQESQKEFQSQEASKGRSLTREQYNSDLDFKNSAFKFDQTSKLAQLELGFQQSERDSEDQRFNKELALYQARHSGGLLGAGGILGTGLGA